jgi:hypothetical protein
MGLAVDFFELFDGLMGVYLRCCQICVAQQGFDGIQVGPIVQQMGSKAVTKDMRTALILGAHPTQGLSNDITNQFRVQSLPFFCDKKALTRV